MRNPIAHTTASPQRTASTNRTALFVKTRRLKAVEKLFMTICEKLFSAQELQRCNLKLRVESNARDSQLHCFSEFKCQTRICFQMVCPETPPLQIDRKPNFLRYLENLVCGLF